MPKIIIINISDKSILGKETYNALIEKYDEDDVSLYNLLTDVQAWLGRQEGVSDEQARRDEERLQYQRVRGAAPAVSMTRSVSEILNPDIIVCVHGELRDTINCYYEDSEKNEHKRLMSYERLADWLLSHLNSDAQLNLNEPVNFILSMCYGARTTNVRQHHVNEKDQINFEETFAGNFVRALSEKAPELIINLKAYTGTVKFNERNGEVEVSTEETVLETLKMQDKDAEMGKLKDEIDELEREKAMLGERFEKNSYLKIV